MDIIKDRNGTITVILRPKSMSYQDFTRQYDLSESSEFSEVELPPSKHHLYKKVNGVIVANEEKNLLEDMRLQKIYFTNKIREKINTQAQSLGFDDLYNAGVYQTETNNPLKSSADALGAWAGNVWGRVMQVEQQVANGEMEAPKSWEELEAMLPTFALG